MPSTAQLFPDPATIAEAWEIVSRFPLDSAFWKNRAGYFYARIPGGPEGRYVGSRDNMARVERAQAMVRAELEEPDMTVRRLRILEARAYARPNGREAGRPKALRARPSRKGP